MFAKFWPSLPHQSPENASMLLNSVKQIKYFDNHNQEGFMPHILGSFHKGNFSNDGDRNDREKVIRFEININLHKCDYFAIFPSCLITTMLAKCATTGLVCAPQNQTSRIQYLSVQVVIKTSNVTISSCCFAEDGKELLLSACRTSGTLNFIHSAANQILHLWHFR